MERKQIVPSLNHRPKVQTRSEVKSKKVTKQNNHHSPQKTFPSCHSPKQQNIPEGQMFHPPQMVSQCFEINHPENVDLIFPEGQIEQDIETNFPYQHEIIEQECIRQKKKAL